MSVEILNTTERRAAQKHVRNKSSRREILYRAHSTRRFQRVRPDLDIPQSAIKSAMKEEAVQIHRDWASQFRILRAVHSDWRAIETHSLLEAKALARELGYVFIFRHHGRPRQAVVAQEVFQGRVDNIADGIAFITLFPVDGDILIAQWPENDLVKESIGKSDLFELTMTDSGESVSHAFRKIPRDPISDDLWEKVEKIREFYGDLVTKDENGEETR
jgi:hypothetical protein